jgi:acetylornithine deacetylase
MSTLEETIAKAVEQRADRIVETLCDIVRFPSVVKSDPREAGAGERDCQVYLQKRLEALGFTTDPWDPDGPALYAKYEGRPGANKGRAFEGRPNLAGVLKGKGDGRSIMLTGHIDVVPPGASEHWMSDPFAPVISEGLVRGRGTVDMKGGVACMLIAI